MEQRVGPHLIRQPPHGFNPGFIGNYIHEPTTMAWHYHKKQHPSKYARQRAHVHLKAEKKPAPSQEERHSNQLTPSAHKVENQKGSSNKNEMKVVKKVNAYHKHSSSSVAKTSIPDNPAVKRLLKDLRRCDVFINRSLASLHQVSLI